MTSRKWVRLFLSTLLLGGVTGMITSFFVKSEAYAAVIQPFSLFELLGLLLMFLGLGFIFSIISQMGFFAYLTVNQFGLGIFKGLWKPVQIVLIGFTIFDLIYFRYRDAEGNVSIFPYIVVGLVILLFGMMVAYVKAKETNKQAFIPALFFMVVITTIEWVPALRVNNEDWLLLMVVPLLACNTYQLLLLHRITEKSKEVTVKKKTQNKGKVKKKK